MKKKNNEVFNSIYKGLNEALEEVKDGKYTLKRTKRYYRVIPDKKTNTIKRSKAE